VTIDLTAINYLAVLVAGFAAFFIGAMWYTALFGKLSVKVHGFTEEWRAAGFIPAVASSVLAGHSWCRDSSATSTGSWGAGRR
jgi:hypothetical protein